MLKCPLRCVLRVLEAITLPTSWFGGGVSHCWVTPLHFCEKGVKTGARVYQECVLEGVVKHLNTTVFSGQKWVFQQDSAPAHKAKMTQEWLWRNVDTFIRAVLEDMACRKCHKNLDNLKRSLVTAVAEIPWRRCMPR